MASAHIDVDHDDGRPIVGYVDGGRVLAIPRSGLGAVEGDDWVLRTLEGEKVGKVVDSSNGKYLVFALDEDKQSGILVLVRGAASNEERWLVSMQTVGKEKDVDNQLTERISIALITLVASLAGLIVKMLYEDRRTNQARHDLLRLNMEAVLAELAGGASLRDCVTIGRLFPGGLSSVAHQDVGVCRELLKLIGEWMRIDEAEEDQRRDELVGQFRGVVESILR